MPEDDKGDVRDPDALAEEDSADDDLDDDEEDEDDDDVWP